MSAISWNTLHIRKTKLHVSLDHMLQGNKNHVSRCHMPPWQPLDIVKKTNLDNKQHHTNGHKRKFLMLWNVQSSFFG